MSDPSSDFFRYGRGYALYSQGMTDVGAMTNKDSTEQQRFDAAIDRDTLLLAKAAGPGLTLEEYKRLHDQVHELYQQYHHGQLTNAAYQERLWSLPQLARSDRGTKSPHYQPTRDKSGNPVAGKPTPYLMPTERLAKLSPGMAYVPPPKLESLLAGRGDSSPAMGAPATSAVPPGHGSVPVMPGAPPRAGGPVPRPELGSRMPPPVEHSRRGGGLLDKIQTGLDIVGAVEPTPFADGSNAIISALRAMADPQHAGEHLRNAGVSLISMIPYIGDTAKLAKYGGKAASSVGGGGGGRLANLLAPVAGMLSGTGSGGGGAGGSGGSGGTSAPAPSGGGGSGGAVFGLLGSVVNGIGSLGRALGPVGIAVTTAVAGLTLFVRWMGQVDAASRKMIEDNRELAQFSGSLAGSFAKLDNERLLREIHKAEELSGPLGRLTKAQSQYEAAQEDLFLPFKQLSVDIQAFKTQVATYALQVIDYLEPISELLAAWYGDAKDKDAANNVVDFLARQANERMAKRKL